MRRFLQLHLLAVVPPANMNRDDTGRPKTAVFGAVERLRLSSQSLKRAWRTNEIFKTTLDGHLSDRTQRLGLEIKRALQEEHQFDDATAAKVATVLAAIFGKLDTVEGKELFIKQLAFISTGEKKKLQAILSRLKSDDAFRAQLLRAADDIGADPEDEDGAEDDESSEKRKKKKQSKETTKLIKSLREECMLVTDSAVDIAMFGRMLADSPTFNREASVQVAHAITTHRAPVEDDYYTAVDDLKKPDEDMGAGFVGEQEFGSGVFYVYLCADRALLKRNLGDDATADSLARTGLAALIEAACTAFPKGKQASFASRPITAYALAEKGDRQPRTLASAFLEPINGGNLLDRSIAALETVCKELDQAYGSLADERATMRVHANGSHKAEGTLADLKTFASTD